MSEGGDAGNSYHVIVSFFLPLVRLPDESGPPKSLSFNALHGAFGLECELPIGEGECRAGHSLKRARRA